MLPSSELARRLCTPASDEAEDTAGKIDSPTSRRQRQTHREGVCSRTKSPSWRALRSGPARTGAQHHPKLRCWRVGAEAAGSRAVRRCRSDTPRSRARENRSTAARVRRRARRSPSPQVLRSGTCQAEAPATLSATESPPLFRRDGTGTTSIHGPSSWGVYARFLPTGPVTGSFCCTFAALTRVSPSRNNHDACPFSQLSA